MDENGLKMSKSLGNVVSPEQVTEGRKKQQQGKKQKSAGTVYGVDVLRYWVAAHGCQSSSVMIGDKILTESKQELDKLRLGFRFILGNLKDFSLGQSVEKENVLALDNFMLNKTVEFVNELSGLYDEMAFNKVCQRYVNFFAND